MSQIELSGLVPQHLKVRSARILLESLEVQADIGFHDFEVGSPQRLLVSVEIWLDDTKMPEQDDPARAWNYDFLRGEVEELATARRYNLQETLAHAIFERLARGPAPAGRSSAHEVRSRLPTVANAGRDTRKERQ